ncbi:hypothetical protein D3C86_1564880 [compost metagenome]
MLAQAHRTWLLGDLVVVVNEGVEDFRTRGLGRFLAAVVIDVLEGAMFVLELEVVPVLATDEHAGVAVLQLQVVDALEDLREGLALLEVQVAVVRGLRQPVAAVVATDEVPVGIAHRPAGANRKRGIELPFDFPHIETDCVGRGGNAASDGECQGVGTQIRVGSYCFHLAFPGWTTARGPKLINPSRDGNGMK